MVQVQSWGDAFLTSISQAMAIFLSAIPKVFAFVLILVVGWFLASLLAKGLRAFPGRPVRFRCDRTSLTSVTLHALSSPLCQRAIVFSGRNAEV